MNWASAQEISQSCTFDNNHVEMLVVLVAYAGYHGPGHRLDPVISQLVVCKYGACMFVSGSFVTIGSS